VTGRHCGAVVSRAVDNICRGYRRRGLLSSFSFSSRLVEEGDFAFLPRSLLLLSCRDAISACKGSDERERLEGQESGRPLYKIIKTGQEQRQLQAHQSGFWTELFNIVLGSSRACLFYMLCFSVPNDSTMTGLELVHQESWVDKNSH